VASSLEVATSIVFWQKETPVIALVCPESGGPQNPCATFQTRKTLPSAVASHRLLLEKDMDWTGPERGFSVDVNRSS
jgi:hypothetical protein